MPCECAAVGCQNRRDVSKEFTGWSFHLFPTGKGEEVRLQKWLMNVNRVDPKTKKLWKPTPGKDRLCSDHFEKECFTMRTRIGWLDPNVDLKRACLLPDAIPTLFLHNEGARKRSLEADSRRAKFSKRKQREEEVQIIMATYKSVVPDPSLSVPAPTVPVPEPEPDVALVVQEPNVSVPEPDLAVLEPDPAVLEPDPQDVGLQIVKSMVSIEQQRVGEAGVTVTTQTEACMTVTTQTEACVTVTTQTEASVTVTTQNDTLAAVMCDVECQTDTIGLDMDYEEKDDSDPDDLDPDDLDWKDDIKSKRTLTEDLDKGDAFREVKYLVFESQLEQLLGVCRRCSNTCQVERKGLEGTAVEYETVCEHCKFKFQWNSQPYSKRLPLGNLVLAAVAFFTACSPTRLLTLFKMANIAIFSQTTYSNLQRAYMVPAVRNVWQRSQQQLLAARPKATRQVKLSGDGRCDSPGHCAKYGAYSFMDADTAEVLHIELVQSNTVSSSNAMELDGLKKGLAFLKKHINISHLVTDRHASIKCHMRKEEPDIAHLFDVWHMAKSMGNKFDAKSHKRGYEVLGLWTKGVKYHMYWSSQTSPEGPDRVQVVKDKWKSIVNHVCDVHTGHGGTFPDCGHGDLSNAERAWMKRDSPVHKSLKGIVESPYLLRDIGMMSPDVQTAHLESFHSVINHFAPKMLHFTFPVMQAKLFLAALHNNENAGRPQATTEEGELQWRISRSKANKGQPTAKPVKDKASRCYLNELFAEVVTLRRAHSSYKKAVKAQEEYKRTVPQTVSKTAGPVDKTRVVAKHRARLLNWQPTLD